MKIIRFETKLTPPQYGWVSQDKVGVLGGDPFGEFRRFDPQFSLTEVHLLAPVLPTKIVAVGRNYSEHAREMNAAVPDVPVIFFKPVSAVIASGDVILIPPQSERVEHEAELAVVVGKRSRWLTPETVRDAIFGYTIANDVTARDLQQKDAQWTRAKGFDTFCPLGPWIETDLDVTALEVTCHVAGQLRQRGSTADMVFAVAYLVSYVSRMMTLEPGDVILTGTPAGVGPLHPGDTVVVRVAGIGELHNPVVAGT